MVILISFIEEKYVVGTHWILLNKAIPMFTDNMSYLNKDFFLKSTLVKSIGTASVISAEFRGIRPQMYIEDLLW